MFRSLDDLFGGSLANNPVSDIATHVTKAALERAKVDPAQIGTVVFGHVINTEPRDAYLSRVAAMQAGIPDTTPAMNVNRLCGSGAQAIVSAVQALALGDADYALAGGAETMSRAPYSIPAARWGQKMGDAKVQDMMLGALTCPFGTGHMGVTAENVAAEHGITLSKDESREIVYGMPFADWKAKYQTEASDSQKADFEVSFAENVGKQDG